MSNLREFHAATFEADVLNAQGPVLVEFEAAWCPPCKMLKPVVEQVAEAHAGSLTVGALDVDENPSIAARYQVLGMPTLGMFKGGQLVDRLVGYPGPAKVRAWVQENLD